MAEGGSSPEYVCTLSPELQEKARIELNETPENRDKGVAALREMIKNTPDLKCPTDYAFLLRFLRARKFDVDRAFTMLRNYYEARLKYPDIFSNFYPFAVQNLLDAPPNPVFTVLPVRDANGRPVLWFRPGLWDTEIFSLSEIMKYGMLVGEWMTRDEAVQVTGYTWFEDGSHFCWRHFRQFATYEALKLNTLMQDAFPLRVKVFHIVNAPWILQCFAKIVKMFFKPKLRDRMQIYGSEWSNLLKDMGDFAVPVEYGGKLEVDPRNFRNELLSPEAEAYFRSSIFSGYIDAPSHQ